MIESASPHRGLQEGSGFTSNGETSYGSACRGRSMIISTRWARKNPVALCIGHRCQVRSSTAMRGPGVAFVQSAKMLPNWRPVCSALAELGSAVTREAVRGCGVFGLQGGGAVPDELVELEGSHRDVVREAESVRDVAPGEEITVTVYVRRDPGAHPLADPTAEALKHPQDRRYLTPSEVEASFGASQSDLQAVVDTMPSPRACIRAMCRRSNEASGSPGRPERSAPLSVSSSGTSSMGTSATAAGSAR